MLMKHHSRRFALPAEKCLRLGLAVLALTTCTAQAATTVLFAVGDSLGQGTMDASNNATNTQNAYLQKVADSLQQVLPLSFVQPLLDNNGVRLSPLQRATNLGVDGADLFSAEGLEYYKRAGVDQSYLTTDYLCDKSLPARLEDKYDKVLYPINLLAQIPQLSQMDGTQWWLGQIAKPQPQRQGMLVFWLGNNDSSTAALGSGGLNPSFLPIPLEQIEGEISPLLRLVLNLSESAGVLSFAPYTQASVERNLTDLADFAAQYNHLLDRVQAAQGGAAAVEVFLVTLPYYSAVGYLMDADDLEYYLRKVNPAYSVPASFKRPLLPTPGAVNGDRVSLLTFGMMYLLLNSGHSVAAVNEALELGGAQRDELVLAETEQAIIVARIDAFNAEIQAAAAARGGNFHVVDVGQVLNDLLGGDGTVIDGLAFNRHWGRGNAFTLDGVHPNYTGHALIANEVVQAANAVYGVNAPRYDLAQVAAGDPYVDRDGDGWVPGPAAVEAGVGELLAFFKDPDDSDAASQVVLPADIWDQLSEILLREVLGIDAVQAVARKAGVQLP